MHHRKDLVLKMKGIKLKKNQAIGLIYFCGAIFSLVLDAIFSETLRFIIPLLLFAAGIYCFFKNNER